MHRPDPALTRRLAELGIDVTQLAPRYRSAQWAQAIVLFREAMFPTLPPAEADRKLGYAFASSFTQTLSGALLAATLPLFSPAHLLQRWPRFVRMGRTDVTITVTETGPKSFTIHSVDPAGVSAAFNLGLFDFIFERMKVPVTLLIEREGGGEALVRCSW